MSDLREPTTCDRLRHLYFWSRRYRHCGRVRADAVTYRSNGRLAGSYPTTACLNGQVLFGDCRVSDVREALFPQEADADAGLPDVSSAEPPQTRDSSDEPAVVLSPTAGRYLV